ncbi:unnamed protein product [Durusdinium trenchii]|uniref:Uncharacterized protein n=1 Tax=Durusdinium trenchii TaxID=1381693 RepID=A0ABP0KGQ9_9DINO
MERRVQFGGAEHGSEGESAEKRWKGWKGWMSFLVLSDWGQKAKKDTASHEGLVVHARKSEVETVHASEVRSRQSFCVRYEGGRRQTFLLGDALEAGGLSPQSTKRRASLSADSVSLPASSLLKVNFAVAHVGILVLEHPGFLSPKVPRTVMEARSGTHQRSQAQRLPWTPPALPRCWLP